MITRGEYFKVREHIVRRIEEFYNQRYYQFPVEITNIISRMRSFYTCYDCCVEKCPHMLIGPFKKRCCYHIILREFYNEAPTMHSLLDNPKSLSKDKETSLKAWLAVNKA
jgi:hypothetical protein